MTGTDQIIALGSDHAGFPLKEKVKKFLAEKGYKYKDFGTDSDQSVDYPDFAHVVAGSIEKGEYNYGILICGSGNGISITANKHPKVRCALCWNREIARLARQHNNANILSMPGRFISEEEAYKTVEEYLNTDFEGGRHQKRIDKIDL